MLYFLLHKMLKELNAPTVLLVSAQYFEISSCSEETLIGLSLLIFPPFPHGARGAPGDGTRPRLTVL